MIDDRFLTIEDLEKYRQELVVYKSEFMKLSIISMIGYFVLFILSLYISIACNNITLLPILYIIFMTIMHVILYKIKNSKRFPEYRDEKLFIKNCKKIIVESALNEIFDNVDYQPDSGLPIETFNNLSINTFDVYESNDYFSATYNDLYVERADVSIKKKTDSDHCQYAPILEGQWYIIKFNRTFYSNIWIFQKYIINGHPKILLNKNAINIKTDNEKFNNSFKIFSDNEQYASSVLTSSIIERINALNQKEDSSLIVCFSGNSLYISYNNFEDMYEFINIREPIKYEEGKQLAYNETKPLLDLINELEMEAKM